MLEAIGGAGALAVSLSLAGCTAPTSTGSDGGGDGTDDDTTEATTAGSDGGNGGGSQTNTVEMTDDLKFEPADIQISAGTTVTWENVGSIGHTVTASQDNVPDGGFFASGGYDSEQAARDGYPGDGNVGEGGTYEHTFETEGTYEYFCIPHEMNGMVGTIEVV